MKQKQKNLQHKNQLLLRPQFKHLHKHQLNRFKQRSQQHLRLPRFLQLLHQKKHLQSLRQQKQLHLQHLSRLYQPLNISNKRLTINHSYILKKILVISSLQNQHLPRIIKTEKKSLQSRLKRNHHKRKQCVTLETKIIIQMICTSGGCQTLIIPPDRSPISISSQA